MPAGVNYFPALFGTRMLKFRVQIISAWLYFIFHAENVPIYINTSELWQELA